MKAAMRNGVIGMASVMSGVFCASAAFGAQDNAVVAKPAVSAEFKIAGVLVSATTRTPLGDARVTLVNTKNRREAVWVITQEDGRFEFAGIAAGKFSVEGARRGYIKAAYEQHEQYSTAIVTGGEFDTENLTLRLMPMGMLTGRVLDEYGDAVREAHVRLYMENHGGGATRVFGAGAAITDDQGTYEFTGLQPGKYYVSVAAKPWYAVHPMSQVAEGAAAAGNAAAVAVDAGLDAAYPTTYSGGATESDAAEGVVLAGGEQAQIDIHLRPVPSLHLIFHVPDNGEHGIQV